MFFLTSWVEKSRAECLILLNSRWSASNAVSFLPYSHMKVTGWTGSHSHKGISVLVFLSLDMYVIWVCVCCREAISRLCEKTSVKTAVKTKRVWHKHKKTNTSTISADCEVVFRHQAASKGPSAVLGEINMQFSGSRVILTVSTNSVTLMAASTLQVT